MLFYQNMTMLGFKSLPGNNKYHYLQKLGFHPEKKSIRHDRSFPFITKKSISKFLLAQNCKKKDQEIYICIYIFYLRQSYLD